MKKLLNFLGKGVVFGLGFFLVFVGVYFVSSWTAVDNSGVDGNLKAETDDTLTLDKWNGLVQRVSGIETENNGDVKIGQLAGTDNRCVYADSNGVLHVKSDDCGSAGAGGDDLGSHIATQNIDLDGNKIVSGGSVGIGLNTAGNVGIGTVYSGAKLNVDGTIQSIQNSSTGQSVFSRFVAQSANASLELRYTNDSIGNIPADVWQFRASSVAKKIIFSAYDTYTALVVDTAVNKVGIGTSNPTSTLDVNGEIKARDLLLDVHSGIRLGILYDSDTPNKIRFRPYGGEGIIFSDDGDTPILTIDSVNQKVEIKSLIKDCPSGWTGKGGFCYSPLQAANGAHSAANYCSYHFGAHVCSIGEYYNLGTDQDVWAQGFCDGIKGIYVNVGNSWRCDTRSVSRQYRCCKSRY